MEILLNVLGGLGLFLFGMNMMSDNLQKTAGDRLRNIIEILTRNTFMSIFIGALLTVLLQSSSGLTVMSIGFVNAGMMTLTQAAGVMMGANIGTTITGQLIALNLSEYAPIAVITGVGISLFTQRQSIKAFADVITAIGILFIGMDMMGSGLVLLSTFPQFVDFMTTLNNPFLGMLAGLTLTTVVQSSSASVGMLQALGAEGLISMSQTFPLLYGTNIGTTTTGLLSSIGADKNAKKSAILNLIINLVGALTFLFILQNPIQNVVEMISPDNVSRQIANAHSLFNLITVLIQVPFLRLLVKFVEWLIPGEVEKTETATIYLDERLMETTPSVAIHQASRELVRMADIVRDNLIDLQEALVYLDLEKVPALEKREELINQLELEITNYLVEINNLDLTDGQHNSVNKMMYIVNDLERMGDYIDNLKETTEYLSKEELYFSDESLIDLNLMFDKCIDIVDQTRIALDTEDMHAAYAINQIEDSINELENKSRKAHLKRLTQKKTHAGAGIIYLETISNLERFADHAYNISTHLLNDYTD